MADIPHFDYPFRFHGGTAVVNEQDSIDDVAACVTAIVLVPFGTRDDNPIFGIADQTFTHQPLPADDIASEVMEQEPRAEVLIRQHPDVYDALIADINIDVSTREVKSA